MAMPKSRQANSDLTFGLQLFHVSWSKTHFPILPVYIQSTTSFDSSNKRNFQSQKTHVFGLFVWTSGSYIHVDHILRHCTKLVPLLICWSFGVWIIFTHLQVSFLQHSLHCIRYFHPLQGHIPKLDQVLHSQLVTHVLWCYHRLSCARREVLFLDQRYRSWLE